MFMKAGLAGVNRQREEPVNQPQPKPFCISKHVVLEAWERVKANRGAAGIDEESIEDFERKLKGQPVSALESDVVRQLSCLLRCER